MKSISRTPLALALAFPLAGFLLASAAPPPRKTVAVVDFDNHSGVERYDQLGKGLATMMISDLSAVDQIQLVEREHLQDIMDELFIQQGEYFDPATAGKLGRMVGANYLVVGAITAVEPNLRIDTRVLNVETGEIVTAAAAQGKEEKFFVLQKRLSDQLIENLEVELSPQQAAKLQKKQDANRINEVRTAIKFSQAIDDLDNEDYVAAFQKLGPVMKEAPGSELVRLTYDQVKKRATAAGKQKAKSKLLDIIRRQD